MQFSLKYMHQQIVLGTLWRGGVRFFSSDLNCLHSQNFSLTYKFSDKNPIYKNYVANLSAHILRQTLRQKCGVLFRLINYIVEVLVQGLLPLLLQLLLYPPLKQLLCVPPEHFHLTCHACSDLSQICLACFFRAQCREFFVFEVLLNHSSTFACVSFLHFNFLLNNLSK